jgi:type VI secretion system secreted protein Hcp
MKWSFGVIAGVGLSLAFAGSARAGADTYLHIDGVQGESSTKPGWIEIESVQWGVNRGVTAPTGRTSDRQASSPSLRELVIRKPVDASSPILRRCQATACHYPKVEIVMRKAGGTQQEYMHYTLTDVLISRYQMSSGGDRPSESVTLNFAQLETQYQPQTTPGGRTNPMSTEGVHLPPPGPGHN